MITLMSLPGPGPFDQRPNEERPDVLVYTSEPMTQDMEVTGPVRMELWTSSSAASTDFTAKLLDVFPDGRSINICEGIVRTCCASGRHEPRQPGAVYRFDIDLARHEQRLLHRASDPGRDQLQSVPYVRPRARIPVGTSPTKISAPT